MRKDAIVDFSAMTCKVGTGRPRRLRREVKEQGWLSNLFFFDAFKAALSSAGVDVESQAEEMFDFRYNQDFRDTSDDGRKMTRGGQEYKLPFGWKRFSVHVKGQYDGGDNSWLKDDESGWAVAYHGTSKDSLPGILGSGFKVGARQKFADKVGAGVYCTPWIDVAQHYSKPQKVNGRYVQIVLQLRVKPVGIKKVAEATPSAHEFEKKYWVINEGDHIRAYGVLIREFPLKDYIPPEYMVFGKDNPRVIELMAELKKEVEKG